MFVSSTANRFANSACVRCYRDIVEGMYAHNIIWLQSVMSNLDGFS
jgi:hypothetical protein